MLRMHALLLAAVLGCVGLAVAPGTASAQHGHSHGHYHGHGHGHYYGNFYGHHHHYSGYGYGYPYSYAPVYRPSPAAAAAPLSNTAWVQVILPDADGEVWFNGSKTGQAGTTRFFESTPLEPGRSYTYKVTAAWHRNGELVTAERSVGVTSGNSTVVDFTRPSP